MRVLVIEDEAKTAAYLRQGLSENGFNVEVCANECLMKTVVAWDEYGSSICPGIRQA